MRSEEKITLAQLESLAWAIWLDMRTPAVLDEWRVLWRRLKAEVPAGAWECP